MSVAIGQSGILIFRDPLYRQRKKVAQKGSILSSQTNSKPNHKICVDAVHVRANILTKRIEQPTAAAEAAKKYLN